MEYNARLNYEKGFMKQNIIEKQLHEISQEARNKLEKWYVEKHFEKGRVYTDVFPYLSIGEMIEFLDEENVALSITTDWTVIASELQDLHTYKNKELCDSLWEAIKGVLES